MTTLKPIISEKSMADATSGDFTFAVNLALNKAQIATLVAQSFGVKVTAVKTSTVKAKSHRAGKTRQLVSTSPWKKAIVRLQKGQTIPLFDVTEHAKKS